ncbi:MAG: hypothetical protein JWM28_4418 [Chitinophagaceae bacterium]|nr:hypothetical protein [Chitinophagaceae bacterium]
MDIIIIGAGPTGLMLSNQLTRFGVDHLILDQKSGPTDQSRALVVHARSLEIYDQLGLSEQVLVEGQKNDGINFYKNGKIAASVTLVGADEKSSPFPYLMMYEQSKNERLLYNNLLAQNREVQWNTSITTIDKKGDCYILSGMHGEKEISLACKYLVACDGGKSMVREYSGVPFTGGSYLNVFFVADTHVDGFSSDKLSIFLRKDGLNMLFAMKNKNHFRALGILPEQYYHQPDLPFEEILEKMKTGMQMPLKFYDTNWHSIYRLHHKKVTAFSKDNLFFAGDAAHVHSPAGGQGMNTGLQDAYNLGWKLALVQKGKAGRKLLDTYHEERNPVAKDLLNTTDRIFSAMSTEGFWYAVFRMYFIPLFVPFITSFKFVRKQVFLLLSQIGVNYKKSSLAKGKAGNVKAGMRLPYFQVAQNKTSISVYQLLKEHGAETFAVLTYQVENEQFNTMPKTVFKVIPVEVNNENDKAFKEAELPPSFVIVVRPDNYISYISATADLRELNDFMRSAYFLN